MEIVVDRTGSLDAFEAAIKSAVERGAESAMILACEQNRFDNDKMNALLKSIPIPIFGGLFPAVFAGLEKLDVGTLVLGSAAPAEVRVFHDIHRNEDDFDAQVERYEAANRTFGTMFVVVDGFSRGVGALLDSLFTVYGLSGNYIGCGAGSPAAMKSSPCVITNEGLLQNGAAVVLLDLESTVSVAHGFQSIGGPFRVTKSKGEVIFQLNRRPAVEVYADVIRAHSNAVLRPECFLEVAKAYPFGIARLGGEFVVRDPIAATDDGAIVCVGEIKEGSMMNILWGNEEMLIQAARSATSQCMSAPAFEHRITFFIDCISRIRVLGDFFEQEAAALAVASPAAGVVALGEIAGNRSDHLNFHNKACVVGALEMP